MKRSRDPNILMPVAAIAAIVIAWAVGSVAVAAGVGLAATALWLSLSMRNAGDASRIAGSLRRMLSGDRSAAMPLRVGATHAALNAAATELASTLAGTRDSLASERLRRRILEEALREGLVILDAQQRVLAANGIAGHMLGFDPAMARGRLLQECVRAPGINALLDRAFAEGNRQQQDLEPPGMPGLVAETVAACVRDEGGRVAGALLLLSDVTAARSLDRMRSDFAANVSHELRTPITSIRGYVETLLQVGLEERETATRFLEIVHRNASRLGALVEDLLSLSFVENPGSRDRLEMAPVDVARLLDWVEAELGPAAEARGIRLARSGDTGLRVHANTLLAEQAIGNLVSNAIRYAPDGSCVEVAAHADRDAVAIEVRDQGPGIPERHLPRLFERFYRVEASRAREGGGTGLGLAIVKHIAMVHGGSIEVASAPGRGSTFTLRLPAAGNRPNETDAAEAALKPETRAI